MILIILVIVILTFTTFAFKPKLAITMVKHSEVVVVGSAMIDLVSYCPVLPKYGETVKGTSFAKSFGGKGANQAVQCALLGLKTSFVGKLGDDDFGKEYYDNLLAHNIDVSSIQKSSMATTGVACISVAENGANTIVIIPSANNLITKEDVFKESNKIKQARVLICQNEIPYHATLQALKLACEENKKIIIVLNPAPAAPYAALSELLALSDIVCPNESELTTLTGMPAETLDQVEVASKALFRMIGSGSRCNAVVVTLGERGAMIVPRSGTSVLVSITEEYRVTAIDTVGAGDCFIGTMASHLARARSLQESVHSAVRCATISVTKKGAQASYPALADLPVDLHPPPARFDTD